MISQEDKRTAAIFLTKTYLAKADFLLNYISYYQHEMIYVIVPAVTKGKEKGKKSLKI